MAAGAGGKALQRGKVGGCQHLGVPSCVGQSSFSPTGVSLAWVGRTSPGSSFGARASAETSGHLLVTSAHGTAPGMLSPGRRAEGAVGQPAGRAAPQPSAALVTQTRDQ